MYDTLDLADVFAVIAYYLAHRAEVDEYLGQCDEKAEALRRKSRPPTTWADQGGTVGPGQGKRVEPVIRLFADQNFNERILKGLAHLPPAIDVLHVRNIGFQAAADSVILERAAADGRIVLTHDRQTLPGLAYARVAARAPMPGVFLVSKVLPIGQAIAEILLAVQCLSPEECKDIVKYSDVNYHRRSSRPRAGFASRHNREGSSRRLCLKQEHMSSIDADEIVERRRIGDDNHSGLTSRRAAARAHISSAVTPDETLRRLRTPSVSRRLKPKASASW